METRISRSTPTASAFAQIYFRIVANIQASAFSFYFGIAADQRMGEHDIIEVGKGADDGIFDDRIIYTGFFANGHIGADDRIFNITSGCNAHGMNDDGIFHLVIRRNTASEFFQKFGIRFEQRFFLSAIKPVLHFE